MPIKSWAFAIDDHVLRAEIWGRFTGWYRKRLYVDHDLVAGAEGRFGVGKSLSAPQTPLGPITVRFTLRRLGSDAACTASIDGKAIRLEGYTPTVERRFRYSVSEEGIDHQPPAPLGCLLVFVVLIGIWLISIPASLLAGLIVSIVSATRPERRFQNRMRRAGRYLEWSEVENRLAAPSTLIVEPGGHTRRCWWTDDDIHALSPLPIPPFHETFHGRASYGPFVAWIWHFYLADERGKTFLTNPPQDLLAQLDFFDDDAKTQAKLSARYPTLKLIVVQPDPRSARVAPAFAPALSHDLPGSIPALMNLLSHADKRVRHFALECLELAGPATAPYVPQLARHFDFGPWDDRYQTTDALLAAGPQGLDFLVRANRRADPIFKYPAHMALARHTHHLAHGSRRSHRRTASIPSPTASSPGAALEPAKPTARRVKLNVLLAILYWLALLTACGWAFIRHGILACIGVFFAALLAGILLSILPHLIGTLWRIRKIRRASADEAAGA